MEAMFTLKNALIVAAVLAVAYVGYAYLIAV